MDYGRIAGLKGSWEWLEYASQLPAKAVPLVGQAAGTLIFGGRCILAGASVFNNATTSGGINLLDGTDSKGQIVALLPLAANSGFTADIAPNGVLMEIGVFVTVSTANITGSIYVVPLWHQRMTPPGE